MSEEKQQKSDQARKDASTAIAVGSAVVGMGAAVAGLVHPVIAVLAGGLAPVVTDKVNQVLRDRAYRLKEKMDEARIDLSMAMDGENISTAKIDLLKEAIQSSLGTDSEEKVALLTRLLKVGLECPTDFEALTVRRIARTVGRLDELEFRVLLSLRQSGSNKQSFDLREISTTSAVGNNDLVATSLAVICSEGLAREKGGELPKWELTDFGHRFWMELNALYAPSNPST